MILFVNGIILDVMATIIRFYSSGAQKMTSIGELRLFEQKFNLHQSLMMPNIYESEVY